MLPVVVLDGEALGQEGDCERALKIARADCERLRLALPDPDKLELLAEYFDMMEALGPGPDNGGIVQADLRRWARAARTLGASISSERWWIDDMGSY